MTKSINLVEDLFCLFQAGYFDEWLSKPWVLIEPMLPLYYVIHAKRHQYPNDGTEVNIHQKVLPKVHARHGREHPHQQKEGTPSPFLNY